MELKILFQNYSNGLFLNGLLVVILGGCKLKELKSFIFVEIVYGDFVINMLKNDGCYGVM